jgi:hypothetical protein
MTSAVILEFRPRNPGVIEIKREGSDWWVMTNEGWRQITPAVAHTLNQLADTITDKS